MEDPFSKSGSAEGFDINGNKVAFDSEVLEQNWHPTPPKDFPLPVELDEDLRELFPIQKV